MGKKNIYYLVGRDRVLNNFEVFTLNGEYGSSLEKIDLYTCNFKDSRELMKSFPNTDLGEDVDFYIVHQDNNKRIIKDEVLYSDSKDIISIANDSLDKDISKSKRNIEIILNKFTRKMENNSKFFDMVVYGKTGLYKKFINYFRDGRFQGDYSIKYKDGSWAIKSYQLVRNVLDSFSRFENYRIDRVSLDNKYRNLLDSSLVEKTSKDYNPNQWSLFDLYKLSPKEIGADDKIIEIIDTIDTVPRGLFVDCCDHIEFNEGEFSNYENDDLNKFKNLLKGDMPYYVKMLSSHNFFLQEAETNLLDTSRYEKLIMEDKKNIVKYLRDNPYTLEYSYEWCLLYNKYKDKSLGDVNGYQKRRDD